MAGVSGKAIDALAAAIVEQTGDKDELERLSSGVHMVKVQAMERLARFNVFAGILWGALFWFAGARLLSPTVTPDVFEASLWPTIAGVLVFLVVFTVAVGYATAVRVVYQTLDFALIEAKARLALCLVDQVHQGALAADASMGR
ncbi:hypothetical protein [Xanthomonas citri]|uniref:hypothetical protein n=1 Tax=Xanthomonas citri TaxID=346 RepID=UPI001E41D443|nr:hypothetical protein [Xanthomonas citri]